MAIKTTAVGDRMIKLLREEGCWSVCSRDGIMNEACGDANLGRLPDHPVNRMDVATRWLRKDDRFEIGVIRAHNIDGYPARLQLFTLKKEYRNETP